MKVIKAQGAPNRQQRHLTAGEHRACFQDSGRLCVHIDQRCSADPFQCWPTAQPGGLLVKKSALRAGEVRKADKTGGRQKDWKSTGITNFNIKKKRQIKCAFFLIVSNLLLYITSETRDVSLLKDAHDRAPEVRNAQQQASTCDCCQLIQCNSVFSSFSTQVALFTPSSCFLSVRRTDQALNTHTHI